MLNLYRRHVKSCRFWTGKSTNGNRKDNNCGCPVWVDGYLRGIRVNKSLDLRDWTRAKEITRDWEIAGSVQQEVPAGMPVAEACAAVPGGRRGAAALRCKSEEEPCPAHQPTQARES